MDVDARKGAKKGRGEKEAKTAASMEREGSAGEEIEDAKRNKGEDATSSMRARRRKNTVGFDEPKRDNSKITRFFMGFLN